MYNPLPESPETDKNYQAYLSDLESGDLDSLQGKYVLYHQGVLMTSADSSSELLQDIRNLTTSPMVQKVDFGDLEDRLR